MNTRIIIFCIIIFGTIIVTAKADTYKTYVDDSLGFYKVRDASNSKFTYENRTLNINQGDTVIWENDADKKEFTISSTQRLWNEKDSFIKPGKRFEYTFDKPGEYTIYIKESSQRKQTVIVKGDESIIPTPTEIPEDTDVPAPVETTPVETLVPVDTPEHTPVETINDPVKIVNSSTAPIIPVSIKLSPTAIAGIMVAMLSMAVMYLSRRR